MAPELWDQPYDEIDDSTAKRERVQADARVENAATGEQRTLEAVSILRAAIGGVQKLHNENHYTETVLTLFRMGHKHAS